MKIACEDVDRLLKEDDSAAQEALAAHAAYCPSCRDRLRLWGEMSAAARLMRKDWDSPHLWPQIRRSLEDGAGSGAGYSRRLVASLWNLGHDWRLAAALALLVLLPLVALEVALRHYQGLPPLDAAAEKSLLTEQALRDIETTEATYVQSIDTLARLAGSRMGTPATPLLANYREKLMLIDEAIAECRANVEQNRYNTHARMELLAMYREKQQTLQELMKENANEPR